MIFGVLSIFIEPIYIVAALGLLLMAAVVMSSPEAGLLLIFLTLPFLSTMTLVAVLLLIFLSYVLKLICGRRVIKFTLVDFTVAAFLLFLFFGGVFTVDFSSVPKMLVFVCFMLGYFVVKNTVRSPALVRKCLYSLAVSSVLVSLYGLYQNFFGTPSTVWQDTAMFSEIKGRVVSTFANPNVLGEYLILIFPIILALMITAKHINERFALLLAASASCACLVFTWSRGAWLGFAVSLVLFLCLSSKHFFTAGILMLPIFAAALFFGSGTSIVRRFTSLGDSSTSYRLGIWRGVLLMLADVFYFGIGIGEEAFADIYPFYALNGIETAPHSHNLYLQITVEIGLFALIAFLILFLLSRSALSASAKCRLQSQQNHMSRHILRNRRFPYPRIHGLRVVQLPPVPAFLDDSGTWYRAYFHGEKHRRGIRAILLLNPKLSGRLRRSDGIFKISAGKRAKP